MKKINKTSYTTLYFIFSILSINSTGLGAPSLLMGTLQFTKDSTLIPIGISCGGAQITTILHENSSPKITFEIPRGNDQSHFEVLIKFTKTDVQLKKFPNQVEIINTFDYLKIDPQSSYKYYTLDFTDGVWKIKQDTLPETGQIPDRAIIIECYPEWICDFKGGSAVELPTLFINNALIDENDSQKQLADELIKLELTALDSKIINAPGKRQIQTVVADKKRILIMEIA